VVDLKGKHISPGIIDAHSHTGISRGVNEGGQAVTAEVRIEDVTNPDDISWYRQLAGGVTATNNLHGSANAIGGQNCCEQGALGCGASGPDALRGRDAGDQVRARRETRGKSMAAGEAGLAAAAPRAIRRRAWVWRR
jgi:imidazolonepropionase-like amidohydrolase